MPGLFAIAEAIEKRSEAETAFSRSGLKMGRTPTLSVSSSFGGLRTFKWRGFLLCPGVPSSGRRPSIRSKLRSIPYVC
jgi:hypothetical protein